MADTKIDWATKVWNPVTGCTPVGAACDNCKDPFQVMLHPNRLGQPLCWRKPQVVFVNSMGDLFHEEVPLTFVSQVLDRIGTPLCSHHKFVVLTKRPQRIGEFVDWACGDPWWLHSWPEKSIPNLWIGASVWDQESAERALPYVLKQTLGHPILCAEPLLGSIDTNLQGLEWLIMGCESGPKRRDCSDSWFQKLLREAGALCIPAFLKQRVPLLGNYVSRDPSEWPPDLRVRQLPWATSEVPQC